MPAAATARLLSTLQKGLKVYAIDVLPQQVQHTQQNVREAIDEVTIMTFERWKTVDGIYTMETLVHATDLDRVYSEFYRMLKPGRRMALYEYDHRSSEDIQQISPSAEEEAMDKVRLYGAISKTANGQSPSLMQDRSEHFYPRKGLIGTLSKFGFEGVQEWDITQNVKPMIRFLAWVLYIPSMIALALGLKAHSINTVAIVVNNQRGWKYIAVTARKPVTGTVQCMLDSI